MLKLQPEVDSEGQKWGLAGCMFLIAAVVPEFELEFMRGRNVGHDVERNSKDSFESQGSFRRCA